MKSEERERERAARYDALSNSETVFIAMRVHLLCVRVRVELFHSTKMNLEIKAMSAILQTILHMAHT